MLNKNNNKNIKNDKYFDLPVYFYSGVMVEW